MAIQFISANAAASAAANAAALTVPRPANIQRDDLLIAGLHIFGSNQSFDPPDGTWIGIPIFTTSGSQQVYYKFANTTEAASSSDFTFTLVGVASRLAGTVSVFRGVSKDTPFDPGIPTASAITGTIAPSISPIDSGELLVMIAGYKATAGGVTLQVIPDVRQTLRAGAMSGGTGANVHSIVTTEVAPAKGVASGTRTISGDAGDYYLLHLGLRPARTVSMTTTLTLVATGISWSPTFIGAGEPTLEEVQAAIVAQTCQIIRHVDIYESDAETIWMENAPFVSGDVSVDASKNERRMIQISLSNADGTLQHYPEGFWYDKIIKPYRGVRLSDGREWETPLGEFMPDDINDKNFPRYIGVKGRDYTKKLIKSKFPAATLFPKDASVETVLRTIATNGGIKKFVIHAAGKTLGRDFLFEKGTTRQKAMADICSAYGLEIFFDRFSYLVVQEFLDPLTSPYAITFETGKPIGNLVTFEKKASDARIYNHIVVYGAAADTVPVWAEAVNDEPSSPTRREKLGDIVYEMTSPFITTPAQAQDVANKNLHLHALEQFEINMQSLVFPWLEANTIGRFIDPEPNPADPDRYLLRSLVVPFKLGPMATTGSRVTVVG